MLRYKFDLKGSTLGRRTKGLMTSETDRKDLDWIDLKKSQTETLSFSEINKHLIKILRRDVDYLKKCGLIDYSLLLAIELSAEPFQPTQLIEKRLFHNIMQRNLSVKHKPDERDKILASSQAYARYSCQLLTKTTQ